MLPYLEQDNLFQSIPPAMVDLNPTIDPALGYTPGWYEVASSWNASQVRIKSLLCPSDNEDRPTATVAFYLPYATGPSGADLTDFYYWATDYGMAKTSYNGCQGANGNLGATSSPNQGPGANLKLYDGIFNNRSRLPLTRITDGTSNTLMYGETCGGALSTLKMQWSWITAGALPTRKGITTDPSQFEIARFSSRHNSVVQFCMGDGSVRGVRPGQSIIYNPASPDWWLIQALAGKSDGVTGDFSAILP